MTSLVERALQRRVAAIHNDVRRAAYEAANRRSASRSASQQGLSNEDNVAGHGTSYQATVSD
jgi:hypothetical protein